MLSAIFKPKDPTGKAIELIQSFGLQANRPALQKKIAELEAVLPKAAILEVVACFVETLNDMNETLYTILIDIRDKGPFPAFRRLSAVALELETLKQNNPDVYANIVSVMQKSNLHAERISYAIAEGPCLVEEMKLAPKSEQRLPLGSFLVAFCNATGAGGELRLLLTTAPLEMREGYEQWARFFAVRYLPFAEDVDNKALAMKLIQPITGEEISDYIKIKTAEHQAKIEGIPAYVPKVEAPAEVAPAPVVQAPVKEIYVPTPVAPAPPAVQQAPVVANTPVVQNPSDVSREEALAAVMAKLDGLTGLASVKNEIRKFATTLKMNEARVKLGIPEQSVPLNSILAGAPGTGKTTVIEIIVELLYIMGLLKTPKVTIVKRQGLVSGMYGQTGEKTEAVFRSCDGGALVIDEAYALYEPSGSYNYGGEVIDTLVGLQTDKTLNVAVFLLGYHEKLELMFANSNPGFRDRFQRTIHFPNYSADELMEIFKNHAKKKALKLSTDAEEFLRGRFAEILSTADDTFSNARFVIKCYDDIVGHQGMRLNALGEEGMTLEALTTIEVDDILI